jgi:hypothetical protein
MKKFVKDNFVLVIGLALPILLIVFFFIATVIPKSMSTPPQHEMFFTTVDFRYQNTTDYSVDYLIKDKHIMVKTKWRDEEHRNYNSKKLMVFNGISNTVREIEVDVDAIGMNASNTAIILEGTKNISVDVNRTSLDGYTLEQTAYGSGGLLGGLFGGRRHNRDYRLKKGSVAYVLPDSSANYYYNQVRFLGWVVNK